MKYVIMAANGSEKEFAQLLNNNNFQYEMLLGVYKGFKELSFKIRVVGPVDIGFLKYHAKRYAQESILLLDAHNQARLVFLADNRVTVLGLFQRVSREIAETYEAYSYSFNTQEYFLAI